MIGRLIELVIDILDLGYYAKNKIKGEKKLIKFPFGLFYFVTVLVVSILIGLGFVWYKYNVLDFKNNRLEMENIIENIQIFKNDTGEYPESLKQIIGNNPVRHDWENDVWGQKYIYS